MDTHSNLGPSTLLQKLTPFAILIGTGKTLLARAVSKQLDANFLKVVSSAIVDKYIGESARLIREMFGEERGKRQMEGDRNERGREWRERERERERERGREGEERNSGREEIMD